MTPDELTSELLRLARDEARQAAGHTRTARVAGYSDTAADSFDREAANVLARLSSRRRNSTQSELLVLEEGDRIFVVASLRK